MLIECLKNTVDLQPKLRTLNFSDTLFPSGPAPEITIELTLQNGEVKTHITNLSNRLTVNNLRVLTLDLGEIYSSSSSGNDFEVGNWTESDQTIDI